MKNQLKKNDKVQVISGKDKGKVGEILELCKKFGRIKVEGVNVVTKHVKARRQGDVAGIQKREDYIDASNVMPVDAMTGKPVRVNKIKRV
ncbi:MAG TPA: 50S ribosomal protein L24 [Candidatus Saccharimonadales bacterium]|nr:50S ribosomal protein L24 [Candidatus Saccharimonadales bacterium]